MTKREQILARVRAEHTCLGPEAKTLHWYVEGWPAWAQVKPNLALALALNPGKVRSAFR